MPWIGLPVAFAVTALTCWLIVRTPLGRRLLDRPNPRSLHETPTPRGGGVAIWLGLTTGLAAGRLAAGGGLPLGGPSMRWLLGSVTVLVWLGVVDDRRGLQAPVRLAIQTIAVVAYLLAAGLAPGTVVVFDHTVSLGPLSLPVAAIAVLWMLNLYNFMDGMDGFAGSMTVTGFATLSWLAWSAGVPGLALAAALPAAAALGFLLLNFPPARLFLGDSGSVPLGFLAAALSLWGVVHGIWDPVLPLIVFAPFVVDATATLLRRLARRERVWVAHRTHVYQRLVVTGLGHRRTLMIELAFMLVAASLAIAAHGRAASTQALALMAVILVYVGLLVAAGRLEAREARS